MNTKVLQLFFSVVLAASLVGCAGIRGSKNSGSSSQSGQIVGGSPYQGVSVVTWHNDNSRTGLNASESTLTVDNVNASRFGKLFSYQVDGHVYAQPLYVSNVPINNTLHNVIYIATAHDTVYAFDADFAGNGAPLWKTSILKSGEGPASGPPAPSRGIISTPVIDLGSRVMYVVGAINNGTIRLASIDLETGTIRGETALSASVPSSLPGTNGQLQLSPSCLNRAGLLLTNGTLYLGFGGCAHGWILSYDAASLHQIAARSTSPNSVGYGKYPGGGGIWGSGAGPAADDQGNVFIVTGDGPNNQSSEWGMSVLKLDRNLNVLDWFTPYDAAFLTCRDLDLGGAGVMLIPGTNDLVVGGKNSKMFVLSRSSLGHQQDGDSGASAKQWYDSSKVYQQTCTDNNNNVLSGNVAGYRIYGTAAFYNGSLFLGADPGAVKKFSTSLSVQASAGASFPTGNLGTTPSISANGTSNGIVWAIDHGTPLQSRAVLHAYNALDLSHELWNSAQNGVDAAGLAVKFTIPTIANGKVFLGTAKDGTNGEVDVYGLLPQ